LARREQLKKCHGPHYFLIDLRARGQANRTI
jgi:hypothetical protein